MVQEAPGACLDDILPPTFGGITGLVPQANGSLLASWSAGSDPTLPIMYDVYIAAGTVLAAALFLDANKIFSTFGLSAKIWTLADLSTVLAVNQNYTVGVRARDGVGNQSQNVQLLTAESEGVLPDCLTQVYADLSALVTNLSQQVPANGRVKIKVSQENRAKIFGSKE
jgi:hypothetical protein